MALIHILHSFVAAFVAALFLDSSPQSVSQVYIVLNTTGLLAAAFWLGVQWNTIQWAKRELILIQQQGIPQVTSLAEMKTTINNIKDDVENIASQLEHLQRSILVEAMRSARKEQDDDDPHRWHQQSRS